MLSLYKEGVFVDMWTVAHILFGLICFFIIYENIKNFKKSLLIIFLLAVFWEFIEIKINVEEFFSNRIVDVLVTLIAFFVIYFLSKKNKVIKNKILFYVILFVYFCVNFFGWFGYIFI